MQVCVPSTPAQMFHMLRRQMLQPFRKPLIVMTPKSLLRHELSVSVARGSDRGGFARVIDEIDERAGAGVRRVVFCSGKVYFDLLKARRARALQRCGAGAHRAAVSVPGRGIPGRARRATRTPARSSGARKSRRIRAPGTRSATACRSWRATAHGLYAGRAPAAAPATGIGADPRGRAAPSWCRPRCMRRSTDQATVRMPRLSAAAAASGAHQPSRKSHEHRDPRAAAARVGRRRDAGGLAQAAGRCRQPRREPRRPRDRQGGARSAGAGRGRAAGDQGAAGHDASRAARCWRSSRKAPRRPPAAAPMPAAPLPRRAGSAAPRAQRRARARAGGAARRRRAEPRRHVDCSGRARRARDQVGPGRGRARGAAPPCRRPRS